MPRLVIRLIIALAFIMPFAGCDSGTAPPTPVGVVGLNTFPYNLFFIPYYGLAIISFFGHISAVHSKKMKSKIFEIEPAKQSYAILFVGVLLTVGIFYGLTNGFSGIEIPAEYGVLIGK